ncbi:MAG TPA: virulence protein RhuM/Fic/DOC family protein [Planctomycetota bacterium]|nr:virulence protein RhuM/Fic/DOC family protein [Planctomycetota bacterium]
MSAQEPDRGEVIVFEAQDGSVRLDVRLKGDTVWLSQRLIAELLDTSTDNVGLHLRNIYAERELDEATTTEDSSVVQTEGKRRVSRPVRLYNLDAILSVGYRVNSKRGTQFRIWATRTLKEHLVRGYTLNERRLAERGLGDIEAAVGLLARTLTAQTLVTDEGAAALELVRRYVGSWRALLEYDEQRLPGRPTVSVAPEASLGVREARGLVAGLRADLAGRGEAGPLFGQERGDALAGILGAIEQTFGGAALYPDAQSRAAHLLYFVIKDHPFSDGNKRIGALLFLEYLRRHGLLLRADGAPRFADNAIVALALLIAESEAAQKDLMVRLTLRLLETEAP